MNRFLAGALTPFTAVTMPTVVFFMHAFASGAKIDGFWVDLSLVLAALQLLWYTSWGLSNKIWWLGLACVPVVTACYVLAHVYTM